VADLIPMTPRFAAAALLAGFLAACSERDCPSGSPFGPVRDVPYYLAHPEEGSAVLAKCNDNPGGLMLDGNCRNAGTAESRRRLNPRNTGMPKIRLDPLRSKTQE